VYHDDVLISVFNLSQQPNCLEIQLDSLKIVWQISSETWWRKRDKRLRISCMFFIFSWMYATVKRSWHRGWNFTHINVIRISYQDSLNSQSMPSSLLSLTTWNIFSLWIFIIRKLLNMRTKCLIKYRILFYSSTIIVLWYISISWYRNVIILTTLFLIH
jgi:hypothetical protein